MKRDISSAPVSIPGSARPPLAKAKLVAKSDKEKPIRVSTYARRNPQHVVEAVYIPDELGGQLPQKRKYLTAEQFEAIYGADPDELRKVEDWAKHGGLKVGDSSARHRRVIVEGPTADIEKIFGLQLNEYYDSQAGKVPREGDTIHAAFCLVS